MTYIHKELAAGRWNNLTLIEQLANIGSEVERAINWKNRGNHTFSEKAIERGLELLSLSLADPKNKIRSKLKELCRLKETLVDYFYYSNEYKSSDQLWKNYFLGFAYAARRNRR